MSASDDVRGPEAVKAALIEAAAEALAAAGPNAVSVRAVARAANVNHGQVHHYFGGKRPLLRAAMHKLASDHLEFMKGHISAEGVPSPLVLAEDPAYWRAVLQCVMEGDYELARTEFEEGISVPQTAMRIWSEQMSVDTTDLDFRARFAMLACLQLGWVALEEFLLSMAEVKEDDRTAFRERVKENLASGWASVPTVFAPWIEGKRGPQK